MNTRTKYTLYVVMLAVCISGTTEPHLFGQSQVETNTRKPTESTEEKQDSLRWDSSPVYIGLYMLVMDGGYEAQGGPGLYIRIPVLRFGNESELYIRSTFTAGFSYNAFELGIGAYMYQWLYGLISYSTYARHTDTEGNSPKTSYSGVDAVVIGAGVQGGPLFLELNYTIYTEPEHYSVPYFGLGGSPLNGSSWKENAFGLRLGIIF